MSNVDAPDVSSGETNNPDLLAEQSGMPNMSSTKTFTVDTNMQVNGDLGVTGTVTATSFVGDGSQLTGISGGTGGGLDSAAVTLLVDSDYVQARVTLDGVGLDSAGVTALVDSDYVAARAPAGDGGLEGFDVSAYDSATSNGIFEYNVSPGNQIRHLYSLNDAVAPTAYDGSVEHQVSWTISNNQQFGFRDAGGQRTKVNARANGTTASTGLVLEGETFNNSGVELVGNLKLSLPTSDPSEAGLLWNDGGIPVFSGSTAPTGGGLDSAEVQLLIDADLMGTPDGTVQIGDGSNAGQLYSTAIGYNASTAGFYTIAIGENASAQGGETVSIGRGTVNGGLNSVALGTGANIGAHYSVAIGDNAEIDGANSIAIGRNSVAGAYAQENGTAIGEGAEARAANTIVISSTGVTNTVTSQYDIDIRTSAAGSLTYDTTNDWTFGAGVTMTDLTASGATVVFSNLPTTDPVNAGQLWNDNGTLKVSAG